MGSVELVAFALFTGITVSGLSGSLLEMLSGYQLSFAEPFVSRSKIAWSLAATLLAGPMMLANDAIAARREKRISTAFLLSCAGTALFWALASGVVCLELAAILLARLG